MRKNHLKVVTNSIRRKAKKHHKEKQISWHMMLPNIITITAFFFGMNSIRAAILSKWIFATSFICIAGILDCIDGPIARRLSASTDFGKNMDSFSDFLCFGIAAPLIIYMRFLYQFKFIGWGICFVFAVCCMLRLARFNTQKDNSFFNGFPSPVVSVLMISPMMIGFAFPGLPKHPYFLNYVFINSIIAGPLMILPIKIPSFKSFKLKRDYINVFLFSASLILLIWLYRPWHTMLFLLYLYFAFIFLNIIFRSKKDV